MQIFTIRRSLHKIKIWNNVRIDSNVYQSLLITRNIDISDLYVYMPLITVNYLPHAYNFDFKDGETLDNATSLRFFNLQRRPDNITKMREWVESTVPTFDKEGFSSLGRYTDSELDDIEFNIGESDQENWRDVPLKEFSRLEEVEEKIYTIEIPVQRITGE